jgi:hypothetical protein
MLLFFLQDAAKNIYVVAIEERNSVSCILFAHYWPGRDDSQMEQAEYRLVMLPPDRSAEDKLKIPPLYAPTSTR